MKLALIQMRPEWEQRERNLSAAESLVATAARQGASAALLPEMFTTGFTMNLGAAEAESKMLSESRLSDIARQNAICIVAGVATVNDGCKGEPCGENRALVIDAQGNLTASYTKMRPFPLIHEERSYVPGWSPVTFDLAGIPTSVFICYDLRFPELFREVAREVSLIIVIANWPQSRAEHWHTLLKARAIENQCYVAGVNRVGQDGNDILYAGGSCVYGPLGHQVSIADKTEQILIAEIDPHLPGQIREEFPFL